MDSGIIHSQNLPYRPVPAFNFINLQATHQSINIIKKFIQVCPIFTIFVCTFVLCLDSSSPVN